MLNKGKFHIVSGHLMTSAIYQWICLLLKKTKQNNMLIQFIKLSNHSVYYHISNYQIIQFIFVKKNIGKIKPRSVGESPKFYKLIIFVMTYVQIVLQ